MGLSFSLAVAMADTHIMRPDRGNAHFSPAKTPSAGQSCSDFHRAAFQPARDLRCSLCEFFEGAQFIHFLLGPATVAIAVPLFRQWHQVRKTLIPMGAALVVGSFFAVLSIVVMGKWANLSNDVLISFLPKSATAGVAMAISSTLGGTPSLTAVLVILTGIIGALVVTPFMNAMRITDYAARGFAVGLTSHGIGTARAFDVDETAGLLPGLPWP